MMCRMWGIHDYAKFTIEIIPLREVAINGYVMDWVNIWSDKLAITILEYRTNAHQTTKTIHPFYYSAYIMYTICFNFKFPLLG